MTRILIRSGKSPFDTFSAHETFDTNLVGNNNGNLVFASAAHKLLSAEGVILGTRMFGFGAEIADAVNNEYDTFVLPLANAFRPAFQDNLMKLTAFIEKLKIPTVMLSGGAQSANGSFDHLKQMEPSIRAFCKAVLKTSSHLTVRGERTAEYLRSLGFNDVLVIGCPSITMNGPGHKVAPVSKKSKYKIAYNIETSKDLLGTLVNEVENHHDATYFPQDTHSLEMMLWGLDRHKMGRDERLPLYMTHSQFQDDKAEFHLDAHTWIQRMKDFDLSFGPRIHGNIVPILGGTPSVVVAHDSRTQELAQYHEIPYFTPEESKNLSCLDEVLERANFTKFNAGHTIRFNVVRDFLHNNGLKTIYDNGQELARAKYEEKLREIDFPEPQKAEWARMTPGEKYRLRKMRLQSIDIRNLRIENRKLRNALEKTAVNFSSI